ncbi:MAG: hypothetical protein IJZ08_06000 [Clostridia bacterium]|nr:hypothetical protein [Clostridia bacterium]
MDGILISNLDEIVKNPEVTSVIQKNDRWGIMSYETGEFSGKGLVAADIGTPADAILQPNLSGWYKIYVASARLVWGFFLEIKLDNEPSFTQIKNSAYSPLSAWHPGESFEEIFWCCADLTDREIIFHKDKDRRCAPLLAWLRFVPMTEEEVAEYKEYMRAEDSRNLHVVLSNETNVTAGTDTEEKILSFYTPLKDTDVRICTQEIGDDFCEEKYAGDDRPLVDPETEYNEACRKASAKMDEIVKLRADYVHGIGAELYAGYTAHLAITAPPFAPPLAWSFIQEHPEYACYTRDGRRTTIASFAYPAVRQYAIDTVKRAVKRGYDGVTLIAHRGIRTAFEQPVLDEFARRYEGEDARRIPMNDSRLTEIWCEYFTQFVRDLKAQLTAEEGRYVPIHVVTGVTPETSLRMGVDIAALCKEGLIDHVTAEAMELTEKHIDGCIDADGRIDLAKYKEVLAQTFTVHRTDEKDFGKIAEGAKEFIELTRKYGTAFFCGTTPAGIHAGNRRDWLEKLAAAGVENFSVCNFVKICRDRTLIYAMRKIGHEKRFPAYYTPNFYRVFSYDGMDMSTYIASWRG